MLHTVNIRHCIFHGLIPLVLIFTLTSCGFSKPENLKMISPQELHATMQQKDILLVDVHIPEQNHIKNTDYYVPFYRVTKHTDKFPQDKSAPIYLYCKTGPMANYAARTLFEMGYTNIYNLDGGVEAWKEANLPINKGND